MYKKNIILAVLVLFTANLFAQTAIDKPVAMVKLTKMDVITVKKLAYNISLYEQRTKRKLSLPEKEQILETLINQILVFQAAERDNVLVSDDQVLQVGMGQLQQQIGRRLTEEQYKQIIKDQTGMDYSVYKEEIRKQLILEKYVSEKKKDFILQVATPNTEEIQLFYRENEQKFINPEMIKVSHVFLATRGLSPEDKAEKKKLADQVLQKYNAGDSTFEELVRDNTEDKQSLVRDGDLGSYLDRSEQNISAFGRSFIDAVFSMKLDTEVRLLESSQGYHIVKVTQHRDKRFLNLDDQISPVQTQTVREYIKNYLGMQKQQEAFQMAANDVVAELSEQADIQRFTDNIE